ncbi:tryptophanyl-tRNA synthetase [Pseudooceanicola batsensis HTCC2597]|uniref:Tryptophanyl-tRNA synthetase n=1 Tax=Pseudooceanicola batsensis (strain ATCC BAA-863 / DSM 15984 / KCTC 12145 / HTCC2597) TaxID=252305 RepID=A3TUD4_PSEBH|nr:tryptophanyl-tRNA synthetase [Pseudooceanicola batsensis HTCC2597]
MDDSHVAMENITTIAMTWWLAS